MESVDCAVIGAGVVGLACAKALAEAGREVIVLEAETAFGTGISARSSEVIHAGLYYTPGSRKAHLCVAGRELLYAYCSERGVDHRRCGKLVVASRPEQAAALTQIRARAEANGVRDLVLLDRDQIRDLEPALSAHAALRSPSTGIIDSHGLMLALLGDAERAGAVLALASPVQGAAVRADGIVLRVGGATSSELSAQWVINAAGLSAIDIARRVDGLPGSAIPQARFARGVYFALAGTAPFSHLIYPIPEPGGLGIHLTLDLGGQARFGPDVEWIATPDFHVDPARAERFAAAVRRWWPEIDARRLAPGYAGVRPKIVGPGEPDADFRIDSPADHGVKGLINLFGIESPGLTASLAIGREVATLVCR